MSTSPGGSVHAPIWAFMFPTLCRARRWRSAPAGRVPGDVYEAQVALMEMSLNRDAILAGLREARRAAATT